VKGAMAAMGEGTSVNRASAEINNPRRTSRNHMQTGQSRKKLGCHTYLIPPKEIRIILKLRDTGMPVTLKVLRCGV
jgi:hypothetical protein